MSNDTVILVEDLWKKYRLGVVGTGTLAHDLNRWWHRIQRKPDPYAKVVAGPRRDASESLNPRQGPDGGFSSALDDDELWALRGVSFEVTQGEILGIIGRNGAGKSTLLKILSRTTAPTHGQARARGRIASLLEVGTGFHPELTGRENIFLNGAILGMSKAEIKSKFDEIVAFSEVETYIDTPVKRYSSGMYVRLAFAVAAHLEPEILIVDEVLAVGDASFQKKCLGKMGDVAREGRTILFVSHNMTAIKSLCTRGLLLNSGSSAATGPILEVVDVYARGNGRGTTTSQQWAAWDGAPGTDSFRFKSITLVSRDPRATNQLTVNTTFDIATEIYASRAGLINLSLRLNTVSGEVVFATGSSQLELSPGVARYVCRFPGDLLNDGTYTLNVMIVEHSRAHFVLREVLQFEIHDIGRTGSWLGKWPGLIRPRLDWECTQLAAK